MPDIKSELSKVLTAWNTEPEDEPTMTEPAESAPSEFPTPTNGRIKTNLVRDTFDLVRRNPGSTRAEITDMLTTGGHPSKSSQSMISTLVRRGNLRQSNNLLYVNQIEYSPLKEPMAPVIHRERIVKPLAETPPPYEPPMRDTTPVAVSVRDPAPWSAAAFVNDLTPRQARELYLELHQLFTI